jgi:uncharacterized membrane protein YebE (DUF533 family)
MSQSLTEKMQEKITDGLESAFESVLESKNKYYKDNPQKIPERSEISALIRAGVTQNAAISGGSSLIPGPWGMLAVVPELTLVIRNQIALIYDIGAAHGQKEMITRELLLGVFVSAAGSGAGSLLVITGSKVLVRRASLRMMQKVIALLGGKITQQALKSAVSKWLPGVGAAAMAVWAGYLTKKIGEKANEVFQKDIVNDPNTPDIDLIKPVDFVPADDEAVDSLEFYKLQILVELAKVDGRVAEEERKFIESSLQGSDLSDERRAILRGALDGDSQSMRGIEALASRPDSAIALLSNMVALAQKDGQVHITEKLYIKRIGDMLGFSAAEIDELIS